jgi:hypothetical protein
MAQPNSLGEISGVNKDSDVGTIRRIFGLFHRENENAQEQVPETVADAHPSPRPLDNTFGDSAGIRNNRERSNRFEFQLLTGSEIADLKIPECSFLIKNLITGKMARPPLTAKIPRICESVKCSGGEQPRRAT